MTARERITAVYNNTLPDRIPVAIYSFLHRWGTFERLSRENGLGILDIAFGVSFLSPPFFARPECISEVKDASLDVSYRWVSGELVEVHTYETPVGTVSQHLVKDPSYGSNWRRKYNIESREIGRAHV